MHGMSDDKDYDIFGGSKFIESMRSGGYRDTSYAVAELVDNAIDAGSKHIEILCQDKINHSTKRRSLDMIAILDDGNGMNDIELRSSLLFGDGTRGSNPKDIGKYGMGLPNSSLSQCKRAEVYSWQKSSTPIYSHIDVDAMNKGERKVPKPKDEDIPKSFKETSKYLSKQSGTLVVWSKLDRCSWTTSKKIMEHSQFLIGRIYRKFLARKDITIQMTKFTVHDNGEIADVESHPMLPNDPMYLTAPSSTPGKWGKETMFQPDTVPEEKYIIHHDGKEHEIIARYSIEKDELRSLDNSEGREPGNTKYGQHARKNNGISVIRADREIMLDTFGMSQDPRDRWCGTEIDIPPTLDLVVGLTNNKQQADNLSAMMRTISQFGEDDSNQRDLAEDLSERDQSASDLFAAIRNIFSHIRSMQRRIRIKREGTRKGTKKSDLETKIEKAIERDQREGKTSASDKDREKEREERIEVIQETLEQDGINKEEAKTKAEEWIKEDKKLIFETDELDGSNFFSAQNIGGILRVKINSNHRAYKNLLLLTDSDAHKDLTDKQRLNLTKDGLGLLLASWVRFEDLIENMEKRKVVQNIRFDWGKELDTFLEQNES